MRQLGMADVLGELHVYMTDTGEKPRRIRNISELAKMAGVSAGTVSRALAGKALVNSHTRERIQALAREHGFHPNQMASRLRTGQTGVIGVVFPLGHEKKQAISEPFFIAMLGRIGDELMHTGYDLMLSRVIPGDADDWLDRIVDSGMLDGVLLIGQSDQFDVIERVAERYLPLVVWGTRREGQVHCAVGTDSLAGGRLAAQQLLTRGRRTLAFFGDTRAIEVEQRFAGAQAALAEAGSGATIVAYPTSLSTAEMMPMIEDNLDRMAPGTDGIFAASDIIAMATLRLLHERGRKVPEDIAVIGFDDMRVAAQTVPLLTTIRQDFDGGAKTMVEALRKRIAGEACPSSVLEPELIVRESA